MAQARNVTLAVAGLHCDFLSLVSPTIRDPADLVEGFRDMGYLYKPFHDGVFSGEFLKLDGGLLKFQLLKLFNGFKLDFGGKSFLRKKSVTDEVVPFVGEIRKFLLGLGYEHVSMPRVDWAVQLEARDGLRDEVLAIAAALGFGFPQLGNLPYEIRSMTGVTSQLAWMSLDVESRLHLCVYDAVLEHTGQPVLRVELREFVSRRMPSLGLLPVTIEFFRALGVEVYSVGAVEQLGARVEAARVQVVKGVTYLYRYLRAMGVRGWEARVLPVALDACCGDVGEVLQRWPELSVCFDVAPAAPAVNRRSQQSLNIAEYFRKKAVDGSLCP